MGKTKSDLAGASSLKCQLSPPPLGYGEETADVQVAATSCHGLVLFKKQFGRYDNNTL